MTTVIAVPVKDLVNAKQRLMAVLSAEERMTLADAMLRDVLGTLVAAGHGQVWVVTRDRAVERLAGELGARVFGEAENRGHTAAVAAAQAEAVRQAAEVFATVPGDAPCVTAAEIGALLGAAPAGGPAAVLVPSRSGLGTNGVALAPPAAMPLTFGEPSFDNHVAVARAAGLGPRILRLPGLGLDIDTPEDLVALAAEAPQRRSGQLLARWHITERLCHPATK
jgi:2-phospho-L-lactate guanylyltransferase